MEAVTLHPDTPRDVSETSASESPRQFSSADIRIEFQHAPATVHGPVFQKAAMALAEKNAWAGSGIALAETLRSGTGGDNERAAGCWLLAAAAGGCCWRLLLAAAAGCCCWLLPLAAAPGCCCCCWLLLLTAAVAAGCCCCWLLLLLAAAVCCCCRSSFLSLHVLKRAWEGELSFAVCALPQDFERQSEEKR